MAKPKEKRRIFVTTEADYLNCGKYRKSPGHEDMFVIKKGEVKELPNPPTNEMLRNLNSGMLIETEEPKVKN